MGSKGGHSLPEGLMEGIMQRLPVKSLLRFNCVCKKWYDLIQNPNFINNHYNHPYNRTRLLVHHLRRREVVHGSYNYKWTEYFYTSEFTLFADETLSNTIREDIINPLCLGKLENIMGPVNGLFLVNYVSRGASNGELALWNPATTEFRDLPLPTFDTPPEDFSLNFRFGFGLNPLTGDFKVVCMRYGGRDRLLVQLYSLANDSWKRIDSNFASSLANIHLTNVWNNTYLDGAYYWLSSTQPTIILFDMEREVFREIQTPPSYKQTNYSINGPLMLFNNSIAMLETHYSKEDIIIDVWVMKEDKCWTKHSTVGLPSAPCLMPHGIWMNGELLFDKTNLDPYNIELVFYNHNNRKLQNLGIWENSIIVLNYKASLASFKGRRKLCWICYRSTINDKKRKRIALAEG